MPTLHWIGKDKVINHHLDVPFKVLDHSYGFDNGTQTENETHSGNKIIHGDNLEALKSLLPEYEGRIKCIYIDPPYNTGNEGWAYNDNVNDPKIKKWLDATLKAKDNGKEASIGIDDLARHDKWLCMMYPRLKLLHKLLADDGAIFISIDDNEQANLKLIMDEIFGTSNFNVQIIWNKRVSPSRDAKYFSLDHEYILVYTKNRINWHSSKLPRTEKQGEYYKNPDNDERGSWNSAAYTCNKSIEERPNLYYPIIHPVTGEKIYPKKTAVWAYSYDSHIEHVKENLLYWGVDGKSKAPRKKMFLTEVGDIVPRSLWNHSDVGSTQKATSEFQKIFPDGGFTYPKIPSLVERILQIASDKETIILDSFAGSGTTAHAVLNLNKQDGGNRKFILIEMEDYAETITAERVKRVINGYADKEGTSGRFDYYELGQALFQDDGNINEAVSIEKIRAYIWYTETKTSYTTAISSGAGVLEHASFLGKHNDTAYYFFYESSAITTLNHEYLAQLKTKADQYVIFADNCLLTKSFMQKHHITFKKIPRDITRF